MKKFLSFITFGILIVVVTACSNEDLLKSDVSEDNTETIASSSRGIRTIDQAADVATQALSMLPQSDSRSISVRTLNKDDVKITTRRSKSRSNAVDTLMYVFNFEDNRGFAIIAADNRVKPLIAITEQGYYNPDSVSENYGLEMSIDAAITLLENVADGSSDIPSDGDTHEWLLKPAGDPEYHGGFSGGSHVKYETDTTWTKWVHPNYDLKFGQSQPEGALCPNMIAGCSNIGCLIAMTYLEMPNQLTLSYLGADAKTINIDWNAIKGHKRSFYSSWSLQYDGCTDETHTTIAQICRELGHRNQTDYKATASSTSFKILPQTLRSFGLTVTNPSDWNRYDPYLDIIDKKVVIARGQKKVDGSWVGHVWVVDGFNYWNVTKKTYYESDAKWSLGKEEVTEFRYNHINWGWNGNGNGYFASFIWDPSNPYFYDDPYSPSGESAFTNEIKYIVVSKE